MFQKKIFVLIGLVLLQLCQFGVNQNVQSIQSVDAIGRATKLLSAFFNNVLHPVQSDDPFYCAVETLVALGSEVKLSLRPRGRCRYCCPLNNPHDFIDIYFTVKPKNETVTLKLIKKKGYLKSNGVNKDFDTILYIHGFTEHGFGVSAKAIRDAYLSRNEYYNIMLLNWGHLSVFPWYTEAVENTKIVGKILGDFLKFYNNTGELPVSKLHLIGFSLGSHIAGFSGKLLGKRKIARITGLDPAFPQFSLTDKKQRLSRFDAKYVDIIHTDGGVFGFPISLGHADFYPNGGKHIQPGCEASRLAEEHNFISIVLCNHFHSWRFYAESVESATSFPATHCGIMQNSTWTQCNFTTHNHMGYSVNQSSLGNFYLRTHDKHPFSKTAQEQFFTQDNINLIL